MRARDHYGQQGRQVALELVRRTADLTETIRRYNDLLPELEQARRANQHINDAHAQLFIAVQHNTQLAHVLEIAQQRRLDAYLEAAANLWTYFGPPTLPSAPAPPQKK